MASLNHSSADKAADAARELCNLASQSFECKEKIIAAGALAHLIELLGHSSVGVVEQATKLVMTLSSGSDMCKDKIMSSRALYHLVSLLNHSSSVVVEQAAGALGNLAWKSVQNTSKIFQAGAIKPLLSLMRHNSSRVVEQAARALANLVDTKEYRKAATSSLRRARPVTTNEAFSQSVRDYLINETDVLMSLVDLLQGESSSGVVVEQASMMLRNFSVASNGRDYTNDKNQKIIAAGTLKPLMKIMKHSSSEAAENAAWALLNLSGSGRHDIIITAGVLTPLADLFQQHSSAKAIERVGRLLEILAGGGNTALRWHIITAGALEPLTDLQQNSPNAEVVEQAARALKNLEC